MPAWTDADLPVFFSDFGDAVTFNGVTVNGNFNTPVSIRLADRGFGGIVATAPTLQLPYNAFSPMPQTLATLTVNGATYSITEQEASEDGSIITYSLKGPIS